VNCSARESDSRFALGIRGTGQDHRPPRKSRRTSSTALARPGGRWNDGFGVPHTPHPEATTVNTTATHTYAEVAQRGQQGHTDRARALAVTIPIDHLRGLALLLVNYSRRL